MAAVHWNYCWVFVFNSLKSIIFGDTYFQLSLDFNRIVLVTILGFFVNSA